MGTLDAAALEKFLAISHQAEHWPHIIDRVKRLARGLLWRKDRDELASLVGQLWAETRAARAPLMGDFAAALNCVGDQPDTVSDGMRENANAHQAALCLADRFLLRVWEAVDVSGYIHTRLSVENRGRTPCGPPPGFNASVPTSNVPTPKKPRSFPASKADGRRPHFDVEALKRNSLAARAAIEAFPLPPYSGIVARIQRERAWLLAHQGAEALDAAANGQIPDGPSPESMPSPDTNPDKIKPQHHRQPSAEAIDCARNFKKAKKEDPSLSRVEFIRRWVQEHGGSVHTIERVFSDNPELVRPDTIPTKSRQKKRTDR